MAYNMGYLGTGCGVIGAGLGLYIICIVGLRLIATAQGPGKYSPTTPSAVLIVCSGSFQIHICSMAFSEESHRPDNQIRRNLYQIVGEGKNGTISLVWIGAIHQRAHPGDYLHFRIPRALQIALQPENDASFMVLGFRCRRKTPCLCRRSNGWSINRGPVGQTINSGETVSGPSFRSSKKCLLL